MMEPIAAISQLKFPFSLKDDQIEAVNAWIENDFRGTILYSTGTGKTEIAFECAKRVASLPSASSVSFFNILLLVPRITLIEQNIKRLVSYGIPEEKIGTHFGERKEVREITIATYQSIIRNLDIIRQSNMIIFDEIHLVSDSAKVFVTDPPYYDAIAYGDLSDFFYVWLKRTIGFLYPSYFQTNLVDKTDEAVHLSKRFKGPYSHKTREYFENSMRAAMEEGRRIVDPSGIGVIVFAHKTRQVFERCRKTIS